MSRPAPDLSALHGVRGDRTAPAVRDGDIVRIGGKHWVVCLVLLRCVEGERLLVCFRDGVRRTFPLGRVDAVLA